jgi:hypothetical protein
MQIDHTGIENVKRTQKNNKEYKRRSGNTQNGTRRAKWKNERTKINIKKVEKNG